ncbi:MAG: hypothetical protein ACO3MI_06245 [Candidatus Poseidoniaceae archaeon]
MAMLNLWSVGHLLQWSVIGRFFLKNWYIFLLLSIGWEVLELYLPYEFAKESWDNKISDVFVNIAGFWIGNRIRIDAIPSSRTS